MTLIVALLGAFGCHKNGTKRYLRFPRKQYVLTVVERLSRVDDQAGRCPVSKE